MKINKVYFTLAGVLVTAAALLAANYSHLSSYLTGSDPQAETGAQYQPSPDNPAKTDANPIKQLLQQNPQTSPKIAASDMSSDITSEDMNTLQEALNDFYSFEDEQDREAALMTLGEYPDPKAKEAILYALNDPADIVREQAVSQISNWENEKERQEMLLTALTNDKPEIVVLALESVAELDDPALIQKIKELSSNKNKDISEAAKAALEMSDSK